MSGANWFIPRTKNVGMPSPAVTNKNNAVGLYTNPCQELSKMFSDHSYSSTQDLCSKIKQDIL